METLGTIEHYIQQLEDSGHLDPNCKVCLHDFYPRIRMGAHITDIFAPRHKPTEHCRSGKNPHCSCDTCF